VQLNKFTAVQNFRCLKDGTNIVKGAQDAAKIFKLLGIHTHKEGAK
jgi:hypothetical protein